MRLLYEIFCEKSIFLGRFRAIFSQKTVYKKIAVLAGDGIGSEVMICALRVLSCIAKKYHHTFEITEKAVGGAAIDAVGEPLPADTLATCAASDAILFGSVGGPRWDYLPADRRPETGALLPLRRHFDLFANIRPAGVSAILADFSPLKPEIIGKGFSYTVVRELTGDVYFGEKKTDPNFGSDLMKYERHEVERIARVAFELAQSQGVKVTNVDKANVLATSRFWRSVVCEIHESEFPEIPLDHLYIDNATMQVLSKPHDFGVILTGNLFGDILSDESAQISGSIGMQASASLNSAGFGLFEPMGGSAPDIAGKNIANPIAQILCVALMLENFKAFSEAKDIREAVEKTLEDGIRTSDIWTKGKEKVGTREMTEAILTRIKS